MLVRQHNTSKSGSTSSKVRQLGRGCISATAIAWEGDDITHVDATLDQEEAILIKDSQDQGWKADADALGLMLLRKLGEMLFHASWDVWLGRAIMAVTIVLLLAPTGLEADARFSFSN